MKEELQMVVTDPGVIVVFMASNGKPMLVLKLGIPFNFS